MIEVESVLVERRCFVPVETAFQNGRFLLGTRISSKYAPELVESVSARVEERSLLGAKVAYQPLDSCRRREFPTCVCCKSYSWRTVFFRSDTCISNYIDPIVDFMDRCLAYLRVLVPL